MEMAIERTDDQGLIALDGSALPYRAARDWFGLIVRPMREMDAADWLKRLRLAVYWPNYVSNDATSRGVKGQRLIRRPRRKSVISGTMFLAVPMGCREPCIIVEEVPGVYGWLRTNNGDALRVRESDIETIRRIEAGLNLPPPIGVMHNFAPGDKVRICDDLYSNWQKGTVNRLETDGRISVDVPGLFGRVTPVQFYPHQIEPLQVAQAKPKKRAR